jgi:hypothetical protein
MLAFRGRATLIAVDSCAESVGCGNKKKHKMEKYLSLNTVLSYSLATYIASSLCWVCKTASYEHRQRKFMDRL